MHDINVKKILAERKQREYAEKITQNINAELLHNFLTDRKTYPQLYKVGQELLHALDIQEDDKKFLSSVMSKVQNLLNISQEERQKYRKLRSQYIQQINTKWRREKMDEEDKEEKYKLLEQYRIMQGMPKRDYKVTNQYISTLLQDTNYRYTRKRSKKINYDLLALTLNTILTKEQNSVPRTGSTIAQYIRYSKIHRQFQKKIEHIERTQEEEKYLETLIQDPNYSHIKHPKGKPNFKRITEQLNQIFHTHGPQRTYNAVLNHVSHQKRQ